MLREVLRSAWHLISRALLVELALLGLIAIVLLLNESWSVAAFSTWLFWGGSLLAVIGVAIISGNSRARGHVGPNVANYASNWDVAHQPEQDAREMLRGYGLMYILVLAGGVAIGLSFVVTFVFPS